MAQATTCALPRAAHAMANALVVAREHSNESFCALMDAGWLLLDEECTAEEFGHTIERAIDDDEAVRNAVLAWLHEIETWEKGDEHWS